MELQVYTCMFYNVSIIFFSFPLILGGDTMADVYTFKVKLKELEETLWRDIEITSVSNIAKLGYSVLAAFESAACHLFCIRFAGKRYEILFEEPEFIDEPAINPIKTKLSALKLSIGDTLTLKYDYGSGWEFTIELLSVHEMKRGSGTHYPYIIAGKGKGIIEDTSPSELIELIEETDKTGIIPKVYDLFSEKEKDWDYKEFDLEFENMFFKDYILKTQYAYERLD